MGGFSIRAQFNPARIVSTGAKVDARSLKERKCFLCPENLPVNRSDCLSAFAIWYCVTPTRSSPSILIRKHTPQLILPQWNDFLELTRRLAPFTVFYNGPRSGASAPDHAHFQAVTRGIMPLDEEVTQFIRQSYASVYDNRIYPLTGNLRPGLVICCHRSRYPALQKIYAALPILPGEPEPMMNIFGSYYDNNWVITVIPRKRHRPWQYEAEGNDHLLSSPGAADIGGLFITPLEKDFKKINPELLRDVYQQVCLSDRDVEGKFSYICHLISFQ